MRLFYLFVFLLVSFVANSQEPFITTWRVLENDEITIPTYLTDYDYNVDWGDGTLTEDHNGPASHTYVDAGDYKVVISGKFPRIRFLNSPSRNKIISIDQWGTQEWSDMEYAFSGCENLEYNAIDLPDIQSVRSMNNMFDGATSFNGNINDWDVSNVIHMKSLFSNASSFNQDLNDWDVSSVKDMTNMFGDASIFNGDISNWDVSSVETMSTMFKRALVFNGQIGDWQVGNVEDMSSMFLRAEAFNQNLHQWNVSKVKKMSSMFSFALSFNGDISTWNISNVLDMRQMFLKAESFNRDISQWDVSNVLDMSNMFSISSSFDQDLSNWNVSSVREMSGMFYLAKAFNGDIAAWDVSNVQNMSLMFARAENFNQDLSGWNVISVTNMNNMFDNATSFNQDVSAWRVVNVESMTNMFFSSGFSKLNYDALLKGWSQLNLQTGVEFGVGNTQYCESEIERQKIIDEFKWAISDGGRDEECVLSLEEYRLENSIQIYFSGEHLFIKRGLNANYVKLYDLTGRRVFQASLQNNTDNDFELSQLKSGVYIADLVSESSSMVKRILKQ